jgi:hypothetical protein
MEPRATAKSPELIVKFSTGKGKNWGLSHKSIYTRKSVKRAAKKCESETSCGGIMTLHSPCCTEV